MKVSDKLSRVYTELQFLAGHDDAPVAEVRAALKSVAAVAVEFEKALVLRRLGNWKSRIKAYFVHIGQSFIGK